MLLNWNREDEGTLLAMIVDYMGEMRMLSKTKRVMDLIVFVFTSLAIAGVIYEGMTLKWYSFVGILVVCMDYSFLFATLMHLVTDRKTKNIWLHVFSLVIISMALPWHSIFGRPRKISTLFHFETSYIELQVSR
jgi:hypothetical protein